MSKHQPWIRGELVQTTDGKPPAALEWTCPTCGVQPPIALAGNRFVKRRCACEREQMARAAVRDGLVRQAQEAETQAVRKGGKTSMIPLSQMLRSGAPATPPPADVCWTCPTCGPIEPFALPSGCWIRRTCACQRRVREEREQWLAREAWGREQQQRTFGGWLGAHWVDTDFVEAMARKTFDTYNALRQPEAYEQAYAFAQQPFGNLLFWGGYGTGKTYLEAAICNYRREAGINSGGSDLRAWTSIFVSAPQLFLTYHETKREFDQTAHIRLLSSLTSSPLLVIDDVDKRTPQKGDWDVYWMIFEARYVASRPTVLSTNKREELSRHIGEASLSRFSRSLLSIEMHGDDFRREES